MSPTPCTHLRQVLAWFPRNSKEWAMTAMNVVHMRVKPGKEDEYVRLHQEMDMRSMPGGAISG